LQPPHGLAVGYNAGMIRPRFSLRTLLIFVAVFAVASWGYFIGWPWYQQLRFETTVRQLKVGMPEVRAYELLAFKFPPDAGVGNAIDIKRDGTVIRRFWPNVTYYLYLVNTRYKHKLLQIELYKLPPMSFVDTKFLNFLNGDRKTNPGFKYELIYSDPPAK
jgi:hypothetical protein